MRNVLTEWLEARFQEVDPHSFYRGIFPPKELDTKGAFTKGKYTGIVVAVTGKRRKIEKDGKTAYKIVTKRYSLTDELEAVDTAVKSSDFCICSPLSYIGKERTAEHARMLYAIVIDVDKIKKKPDRQTGEPEGMRDLWHQVTTAEYIPKPTYIVSSGTGLHLYYLLDRPVPLYNEYRRELQILKRELTTRLWNGYVVNIKNRTEIQYEGIYQGFRMVGTITKNGDRVRAFLTGEKVTLEYLNGFVPDSSKALNTAARKTGNTKLAEAEKLWPDWYERRIVKKEARGKWHVGRGFYDYWLEKIKTEATVGHRYYCLMMLAVIAQKCSYYDEKRNPHPVTREELERDSYALIETMDALTTSEDNHFGADDVLDALEAFDDKWITYPRNSIEYKSGIEFKPKYTRKGRKQAVHLKIARSVLAALNEENGKALQGRKSKADVVKQWREDHPDGNVQDCIKDTGLGRSTVYRHWNNDAQAAGRKAAREWMKDAIKAQDKVIALSLSYEHMIEEVIDGVMSEGIPGVEDREIVAEQVRKYAEEKGMRQSLERSEEILSEAVKKLNAETERGLERLEQIKQRMKDIKEGPEKAEAEAKYTELSAFYKEQRRIVDELAEKQKRAGK